MDLLVCCQHCVEELVCIIGLIHIVRAAFEYLIYYRQRDAEDEGVEYIHQTFSRDESVEPVIASKQTLTGNFLCCSSDF